uniref:Uncharacterized protein n=1 Tax=Acrobeloides nanus TaxID=290746 RepID=A0A914CP91_9BILA
MPAVMILGATIAAFTISLWLLNREKKRKTFRVIDDFKPWKAMVLLSTGFVGGIFTAFCGTGLDMTIFSVITLLFRVSEKTATPTTVVSMGF